jgi:pimeloyl-ACP methyl ester carboxylesterase
MPYAAVDGLDMYYEIHGEGSPLLLLHGGAGSIPERWIPFLTPHFRVIAPEQMGHGRTADLVDRPFHYHDMAEDTVELMRQLGIESAVVVGYSDGGIIGLDLAIHHPERVSKLAVTGANARFDG